jgi:hypothetical protein
MNDLNMDLNFFSAWHPTRSAYKKNLTMWQKRQWLAATVETSGEFVQKQMANFLYIYQFVYGTVD